MMKNDNITKFRNVLLSKAFVSTNSLLLIKTILIAGSQYLYSINDTLNIIVAIYSILAYSIALFRIKKIVFSKAQIIILLGIAVLWLITYLVNPVVYTFSYAQEEMKFFFVYALPALVFLPMISSCETIWIELKKRRWLFLIITLLTVFLMLRTGNIQGSSSRVAEYSMSFGRALILPTLLFLSMWYKERKIVDLIGAIIVSIFIFLFGSRFPLLCILFFILWKSLFGKITKRKIIIFLMLCILFAVLIIYRYKLVLLLSSFLNVLGINSRSLVLIASGSFGYDDGRIEIYRSMIELINKSPIIGYGAFGGNYITNNGLSHSFVFDTFANLGYVVGGLIMIASLVRFYKMYKKRKGFYSREFIIICLCQFLPTAIIQTSLWRATNYWYLVALSTGKFYEIDEKKEENNFLFYTSNK